MPPAAWSAREIEQALATLAALAQISTPSAAYFLKSAMARDGAARPGMFAAYAARSAREIELQALALLAALAQNLHTTICRSFTERSSALRAKFCGGSRSATSRSGARNITRGKLGIGGPFQEDRRPEGLRATGSTNARPRLEVRQVFIVGPDDE
jgi:hypothetical protein